MKNTSRMLALALATTIVTAGCGAFETKNKAKKVRENDTKLAGTWADDCSKLDWLGFTYHRNELKFSPFGDFDKATTLFADSNCSSAVGTRIERGTYAALGNSTVAANAKDLNLTVTEATVTPATADGAEKLNSASYCGMTDWQPGKESDILGKDCLGMNHAKGSVIFDVYQLVEDDKRLLTGKSSLFLDRSNANARPNKLDLEHPYSKK